MRSRTSLSLARLLCSASMRDPHPVSSVSSQ